VSVASCGLRSIEIPNSAKWIEGSAFNECPDLSVIVLLLGSHLESIGKSAFQMCSKLDYVQAPERIQNIVREALSQSGLTQEIAFQIPGSRLSTNAIQWRTGVPQDHSIHE
jgi:hypothetical protein